MNFFFQKRRTRTKNRNTCSWKGQFERTRSWNFLSWKVQNEIGKIEVGKFEQKSESSWRIWKVRAEVGKLELKLENTTEVGNWLMKLEILDWTWKDPIEVGKLNWYKNDYKNFPTSRSFQLPFPTTRIPKNFEKSRATKISDPVGPRTWWSTDPCVVLEMIYIDHIIMVFISHYKMFFGFVARM